ncbi:hypothetical protein [Arthrobacter pigmenti]
MDAKPDAETYFAKFKNMLGHIGDVELVGIGFDAAVHLEVRDDDETRTFRVTQNLGEIRARIQLDEATRRSFWPDKDLEEASLAMFSIPCRGSHQYRQRVRQQS